MNTKEIEQFLDGYFLANNLLGKQGQVIKFYDFIQYRTKGIDKILIKYDMLKVQIEIELLADMNWKHTSEAEEMRKKIISFKRKEQIDGYENIQFKYDGSLKHDSYKITINDFEVLKEFVNEIF